MEIVCLPEKKISWKYEKWICPMTHIWYDRVLLNRLLAFHGSGLCRFSAISVQNLDTISQLYTLWDLMLLFQGSVFPFLLLSYFSVLLNLSLVLDYKREELFTIPSRPISEKAKPWVKLEPSRKLGIMMTIICVDLGLNPCFKTGPTRWLDQIRTWTGYIAGLDLIIGSTMNWSRSRLGSQSY